MNSIFSSKLYRACPYKSKIKAALNSPINMELKTQLIENLGEEYLKEEYLGKADKDDGEFESKDLKVKKSEGSFGAGPGGAGGGSPSPEIDDFEGAGEEGPGETSDEPEPDDKTDEPVSESTEIKGYDDGQDQTDINPDEVKGILDSREDTSGAARVTCKGDELWIVYNDSVNLNNVMESVISVLDESGYSNLSFNRLARTENAVVFIIDRNSAAEGDTDD